MKAFPRLAEIPFDSDRKLMTTFHPWENGRVVSFTKGAVEEILERSVKVLTHQGLEELDRPQIVEIADRIAGDGLRALGYSACGSGTAPRPIDRRKQSRRGSR